jgi:hypothetical protein
MARNNLYWLFRGPIMSLVFPYTLQDGGLGLSATPDVDTVVMIAATALGDYSPMPDLGIEHPVLTSLPNLPDYLRGVEQSLGRYATAGYGALGSILEDGTLEVEIIAKSNMESIVTWQT